MVPVPGGVHGNRVHGRWCCGVVDKVVFSPRLASVISEVFSKPTDSLILSHLCHCLTLWTSWSVLKRNYHVLQNTYWVNNIGVILVLSVQLT